MGGYRTRFGWSLDEIPFLAVTCPRRSVGFKPGRRAPLEELGWVGRVVNCWTQWLEYEGWAVHPSHPRTLAYGLRGGPALPHRQIYYADND